MNQEVEDLKIGIIANCTRLNIRLEPSIKSEVVCEIDCGTELIIEDQTSTNDFYKIFTAAGIEGFCMKKFVSIKEG